MTTGDEAVRTAATDGAVVGDDASPAVPSTDPGRPRRGIPRPELSRRVARALAVALLVLWTVWALVAWSAEPRHVSLEQFRSDLAAGQVEGFHTASGRNHVESIGTFQRHEFSWTATPTGASAGQPDRSSLVVYWTGSGLASVRYLDQDETRGDVRPAVQELRAAGVPDDPAPRASVDRRLDRARPFGLLLVGLALVLVLTGPAPRRGTRWAWFFLLGTTYGLGIIGYAVLELWRGGAPVRLPVLRAVARVKWRGWEGYALMLLVSTVASLSGWGLRVLLGTGLVPAA